MAPQLPIVPFNMKLVLSIFRLLSVPILAIAPSLMAVELPMKDGFLITA